VVSSQPLRTFRSVCSGLFQYSLKQTGFPSYRTAISPTVPVSTVSSAVSGSTISISWVRRRGAADLAVAELGQCRTVSGEHVGFGLAVRLVDGSTVEDVSRPLDDRPTERLAAAGKTPQAGDVPPTGIVQSLQHPEAPSRDRRRPSRGVR